ncbi:hypothetical protein C8R46DRAFT_254639 [Mycena filopes]|nr:hypothetical protein C8R46DRAFT_254639 [Mycena filopes]
MIPLLSCTPFLLSPPIFAALLIYRLYLLDLPLPLPCPNRPVYPSSSLHLPACVHTDALRFTYSPRLLLVLDLATGHEVPVVARKNPKAPGKPRNARQDKRLAHDITRLFSFSIPEPLRVRATIQLCSSTSFIHPWTFPFLPFFLTYLCTLALTHTTSPKTRCTRAPSSSFSLLYALRPPTRPDTYAYILLLSLRPPFISTHAVLYPLK